MICLFYSGTLGDNITFIFEEIKAQKWSMAVVYLIYVFLTMFTVLNMLIGVLCEVVSQVDAKSKEDILIDYVRETLLKTLMELDEESDGMISRREFDALMENQDAKAALIDLDVDPEMFGAVSSYLFDPAEPGGPEKELTFAEFLKRVLKMRASEKARVLDIMEMQKHIQKEHSKTAMEITNAKKDILNDISGRSETRL